MHGQALMSKMHLDLRLEDMPGCLHATLTRLGPLPMMPALDLHTGVSCAGQVDCNLYHSWTQQVQLPIHTGRNTPKHHLNPVLFHKGPPLHKITSKTEQDIVDASEPRPASEPRMCQGWQH